mmetsp:Transcript_59869/g.104707  ORF Transcript_59869/g.104707 Transcript_59869/m.104707 type:complete len:683 (+) Transcript_59869:135-2183(+)
MSNYEKAISRKDKEIQKLKEEKDSWKEEKDRWQEEKERLEKEKKREKARWEEEKARWEKEMKKLQEELRVKDAQLWVKDEQHKKELAKEKQAKDQQEQELLKCEQLRREKVKENQRLTDQLRKHAKGNRMLVEGLSEDASSQAAVAGQSAPASGDGGICNLYTFVDDSNLWITAQQVWAKKIGASEACYDHRKKISVAADTRVRISWRDLYVLLLKATGKSEVNMQKAYLFGSYPPKADPVWEYARSQGFELKLAPKINQGGTLVEKSVDTWLTDTVAEERNNLKYVLNEEDRTQAVFFIVSGDLDYSPAIDSTLNENMRIELFSFKSSLSKQYEVYRRIGLFNTTRLDGKLSDITYHDYIMETRTKVEDYIKKGQAVVFDWHRIYDFQIELEHEGRKDNFKTVANELGNRMLRHNSYSTFHGIFFTLCRFERSEGPGVIICFQGTTPDDFAEKFQKFCNDEFGSIKGQVMHTYSEFVDMQPCLFCKKKGHVNYFCKSSLVADFLKKNPMKRYPESCLRNALIEVQERVLEKGDLLQVEPEGATEFTLMKLRQKNLFRRMKATTREIEEKRGHRKTNEKQGKAANATESAATKIYCNLEDLDHALNEIWENRNLYEVLDKDGNSILEYSQAPGPDSFPATIAKKKLCSFYRQRDGCKFGSQCCFLHVDSEETPGAQSSASWC